MYNPSHARCRALAPPDISVAQLAAASSTYRSPYSGAGVGQISCVDACKGSPCTTGASAVSAVSSTSPSPWGLVVGSAPHSAAGSSASSAGLSRAARLARLERARSCWSKRCLASLRLACQHMKAAAAARKKKVPVPRPTKRGTLLGGGGGEGGGGGD